MQLNPKFKAPARPFKRLDYQDAIKYCIDNGIQKEIVEDGVRKMVPHEVGDDIAEMAERKMTDQIGVPIFLTRFPVCVGLDCTFCSFLTDREFATSSHSEIKAFYMKRCPEDARYTESVDVLMPGVGEITGEST